MKQNGALVGSVEYGYDANGNTKTTTQKDAAGNVVGTVTYNWNKENRLVGVTGPNLSVSYAYDADGVRVSKTVNGVTIEYLVDKNLPYAQVLEESVNDALTASYVYGLDLIRQERGVNNSYYLVDGLGSTRGLTDASGVVTDTYAYDAFGNLVGVSGATKNDYLFAGEQFDGGLGQYYLRQRYYNQNSGRFTRRDTYEGSFSNPITLHKYLYGNANPVYFTDPSGLMSLADHHAAEQIRDILVRIQAEAGQQLLQIASQGGNPAVLSGLFTDLAWNLGFQAMPHVNNLLQRIGRSRRSNLERADLYRDALNLSSNNARSRNFVFADTNIGGEQATLLSISGENFKVGTIGPYPFPNQRLHSMNWPIGSTHDRQFDTEYKILEAIANRYFDNPSISGRVELFSERRPCGSCYKTIREFEKMFPNIQINVTFGRDRS